MSGSKLPKAKLLALIALVAGFAWYILHVQPAHSLVFFTPPPGQVGLSCTDSQVMCPDGGTKTFGPFEIVFPNGFYSQKIRVFCDSIGTTSVPAPSSERRPVGLPISCSFVGEDNKSVQTFQRPIMMKVQIPTGYSSQVGMYMYKPIGWTPLESNIAPDRRTVTFSVQQLSPTGEDEKSYFWLFESQVTTVVPKATLLPQVTFTSTSTAIPTKTPTLEPTSTPTNTPPSVPTLTATVTSASGTPFPPSPFTQGLMVGLGGAVLLIIGLVLGFLLSGRKPK